MVCVKMISEERFKEIRDYVMKSTLFEGFEDPLQCASPDVFKRLVTGYLIIKTDDARVISRPVCQSSHYCDNYYSDHFGVCTYLNDNEELLNIVPATKMTFAVYGFLPEDYVSFECYKSGDCEYAPGEFLGFEFEGMDHPNWIQILRQKLINKLVWNEENLERKSRM
jgi:hypothetical protein